MQRILTDQVDRILSNVLHLFPKELSGEEREVLTKCTCEVHQEETLPAEPGLSRFRFVFRGSSSLVSELEDNASMVKERLGQKLNAIIVKWYPDCKVSTVEVLPEGGGYAPIRKVQDDEVYAVLGTLRAVLIASSAGDFFIDDINQVYDQAVKRLNLALQQRELVQRFPYPELKDWQRAWSAFPTLHDRRVHSNVLVNSFAILLNVTFD